MSSFWDVFGALVREWPLPRRCPNNSKHLTTEPIVSSYDNLAPTTERYSINYIPNLRSKSYWPNHAKGLAILVVYYTGQLYNKNKQGCQRGDMNDLFLKTDGLVLLVLYYTGQMYVDNNIGWEFVISN
jgi:hypothetical protein